MSRVHRRTVCYTLSPELLDPFIAWGWGFRISGWLFSIQTHFILVRGLTVDRHLPGARTFRL